MWTPVSFYILFILNQKTLNGEKLYWEAVLLILVVKMHEDKGGRGKFKLHGDFNSRTEFGHVRGRRAAAVLSE